MSAEKYTAKIYEVIEEQTSKYSSTSVHSSAESYGRTSISSTTKHHSDQSLWVRDIATGQECKFEFRAQQNVDARRGHKLIFVWIAPEGRLERVVNVTTNTQYAGHGYFNDWSDNFARLNSSAFRFFWPLLMAVLCVIPVLNFFAFLSIAWQQVVGGTGAGFEHVKVPGARWYGLQMLVAIFVAFAIFMYDANISDSSYHGPRHGDHVYAIGAALWAPFIFLIILKQLNRELAFLKTQSKAIDEFVARFRIANEKTLSLVPVAATA